jgi:hypothetical protein
MLLVFLVASPIITTVRQWFWTTQLLDTCMSKVLVMKRQLHIEVSTLACHWSGRIKDAEENLGESEVREALLEKAMFYIQIGSKVGHAQPRLKHS